MIVPELQDYVHLQSSQSSALFDLDEKNILHVFALQCKWLAEMYNYNSIKSFFARETWSLHLTDFTDILGWDLALVDCQPIKSSNGNLRVPPAVLPGLLASARRCFGWWIPGGTCSAMHLCHSYSILFFKTACIFSIFPQIAIAIGVLTSNRGGGRRTTLADWTWHQGATAGCRGRGAIAVPS